MEALRAIKNRPHLGISRTGGASIQMLEVLIDPIALIVSLYALQYIHDEPLSGPLVIVFVIVFAISYPGRSMLARPPRDALLSVLFNWLYTASLLLLLGYATGTLNVVSTEDLLHWLWLAPLTQFVGHMAFRGAAPRLMALAGGPKRAVVVGCNDQGSHLVAQTRSLPMLGITVLGFFDDRDPSRLDMGGDPLLGRLRDVSRYVKEHQVDIIYLALPMASQPRILNLLDDLRDTTATINFIPNVFLTDLIQGRLDAIGNMPVVTICDTPFRGFNGLAKRLSDIVFSIAILIVASPVLLACAIAVKFTSPGPIIFRQRRYGVDGQEIIVYKFRSMTVCEDGPNIAQARPNDQRLSPIGSFLRRTSLDELPQFINVLQGRMSIVGPRPHAVAHNESYRKLIKGYMVRHKVKPGITGWAQVNGCRGETDTVDKMQARIDFDLEYLRNWSLKLDIKIILKTVLLIFNDARAY